MSRVSPLRAQRMNQSSASPIGKPRLAYSRDDAAGGPEPAADSPRVLLVEDDFVVAMDVEAALSEAGFTVVGVAASADEAVALAAAQKPSLVIMDIRLNGRRDGIDCALQLFRDHGLRCIFATAHADSESRSRAEPASPIAWLPKPYTAPALVALLASVLQKDS
jgi:DNA-binding NarL/FixJ family response regulator